LSPSSSFENDDAADVTARAAAAAAGITNTGGVGVGEAVFNTFVHPTLQIPLPLAEYYENVTVLFCYIHDFQTLCTT
jgi:hypothetical protein